MILYFKTYVRKYDILFYKKYYKIVINYIIGLEGNALIDAVNKKMSPQFVEEELEFDVFKNIWREFQQYRKHLGCTPEVRDLIEIIHRGEFNHRKHCNGLKALRERLRYWCEKSYNAKHKIFQGFKRKYILNKLYYHFATLNRHNGIFYKYLTTSNGKKIL